MKNLKNELKIFDNNYKQLLTDLSHTIVDGNYDIITDEELQSLKNANWFGINDTVLKKITESSNEADDLLTKSLKSKDEEDLELEWKKLSR